MLDNEKNILPDNELETVSGGGYAVPSDTYEGVTVMKCDFCKIKYHWAGDFMNGNMHDCPRCKRHQLHGEFWAHYI